MSRWTMRCGRVLVFGAIVVAGCAAKHAAVDAPLPAPARDPDASAAPVASPSVHLTASGASDSGASDSGSQGVPHPSGMAAEIDVGASNASIRTTEGEVWTWNTFGTNYVPHLVKLPARAVALDHGDSPCAVLDDGTVACWGGTTLELVPKTPLPPDGVFVFRRVANVASVRAMYTHRERTFFLRQDGTVFVIARHGFVKGTNRPVVEREELPALTGAEEIAGGDDTTCARFRDRSVRCWTANKSSSDGAKLKMLPGPTWVLSPVKALGEEMVVLADGTVRAWGRNDHGQLGDGTEDDRATPTTIPGLAGVVQVARGPYSSCAVLSNGRLACWGDCTEFPMVPNQLVGVHPRPVRIDLGTDATDLDAGADGDNARRPPGPAGEGSIARPVAEVRIGVTHACARLTDGRVMCWGDNWDGQVGDGRVGYEREPVFVLGFGAVTSNAAAATRTRATPRKN